LAAEEGQLTLDESYDHQTVLDEGLADMLSTMSQS